MERLFAWSRDIIFIYSFFFENIDSLMQKVRISSALARELRLFSIKPSICP